jgi:hypothetical protein
MKFAGIAALLLGLLPNRLEALPTTSQQLPVVIWHGLGDSYGNPGIEQLADAIKERFGKDQYVYIARVANDTKLDQFSFFIADPWRERSTSLIFVFVFCY